MAIIDSGLDYLHTNFGGPGTPADYAAVTDAGPVPNAYFPSAKVPGGYDFAGDAYDANQAPGTGFDAVPDANPMDSANGHGTAVASLIGGYGTNADGSRYAGAYDATTNLAALKIAPGFAPNAQLYPLRVFGVSGSTNLVVQALDWALDPNGDGNIADRMHVVNMSLGSATGDPDGPDAVATANLAAAGVVVVTSAGNSGDSYFITGSPGVASGAISVAASFNSQGGFFYSSSVTVNSPGAIAGLTAFSIYGSTSPRVGAGGLTGDIVYADPTQGTSNPLANAAAIAGKIALIDRGTNSFALKVKAAQDAGAVAVIIAQNSSVAPAPIAMSLDGTETIPALMISYTDAAAIRAQLDLSPGGTRSGVNVTIANANGFVPQASTAAETLPTYSSRGPRIGDGMLKPDITAPAEVVGVAVSLRGTDVGSFNGTSSAAPHVAGIMTVLRQLHPTWTVEELMASAMNTATHDLFTGAGGTGSRHGVGRVGAGRIDVTNAVAANVVAYNETNRGLVSVSFGIVEVPVDSTTVLNKSISVANKGSVDVEYAVSYFDVTPVAGAQFTVGSVPTITVPAGGTVTLPVTFTATGNLLRHVREAAVPGTSGRQWLTEKTGYAVLTPTSGAEPTLRVPLHAAPKPVSSMRTTPTVVFPSGATGSFTLGLTGAPVETGATYPFDIVGLVMPFELQYVSPLAGSASPPTDPNRIKHVGVGSDYPVLAETGAQVDTVLTFAIEGFGPAYIPAYQGSDKEIFIDADRDGSMDFVFYLTTLTGSSNTYVPQGIRLSDGAALPLQFYTNGYSGATLDTNAFVSNVVLVSALASDMGLVGGASTRFDYQVVTFSGDGVMVDDTGVLTYDLARPGIEGQGGMTNPNFYFDVPATTLPINYNAADYQANGSLGVLVVHMHNASGAQGEARIPRGLTVTRSGNGAGTVVGDPAVLNCGSTCSATFLSGSTVTLTATPATGSYFIGWSGACTGTGTCQVTMDAAKGVTAMFTLQQFTLTVAKDGNGTGVVSSSPAAIDCGAGACASAIDYGTVVTLTATGTGGSTFAGWSGACSGTGTCELTITAAAGVTATFILDPVGRRRRRRHPERRGSHREPRPVREGQRRLRERARSSPCSSTATSSTARATSRGHRRGGRTSSAAAHVHAPAGDRRVPVLAASSPASSSPVVRLYFATFLRVPDYAGLTFNAGLVRNGTVTLTQLADFFAASPEFAATYGALDNTPFVTLLYTNVLGRAPDPAGLAGWVALLNGGYTRGQVLLGFSDSVEYQAAMANEVFVTMMYAGMLRRTPEPAGFNGWVGFLDAATFTREQVINGFFLSTEYYGRFLP